MNDLQKLLAEARKAQEEAGAAGLAMRDAARATVLAKELLPLKQVALDATEARIAMQKRFTGMQRPPTIAEVERVWGAEVAAWKAVEDAVTKCGVTLDSDVSAA